MLLLVGFLCFWESLMAASALSANSTGFSAIDFYHAHCSSKFKDVLETEQYATLSIISLMLIILSSFLIKNGGMLILRLIVPRPLFVSDTVKTLKIPYQHACFIDIYYSGFLFF
jgi:hypothetical protein